MLNLAMTSTITFTARAVIYQRLLTSATEAAQMTNKRTFELQGIIP